MYPVLVWNLEEPNSTMTYKFLKNKQISIHYQKLLTLNWVGGSVHLPPIISLGLHAIADSSLMWPLRHSPYCPLGHKWHQNYLMLCPNAPQITTQAIHAQAGSTLNKSNQWWHCIKISWTITVQCIFVWPWGNRWLLAQCNNKEVGRNFRIYIYFRALEHVS